MAGSDLCVCVACALVFCVLVLVCLCLFVLDLSAVFTRAATPPSSAKFRLLEIVVLSRLSPQPPFRVVLTAGSDLSLVSVFVCFVTGVCLVLCFYCLSPNIDIHSLINCTYIYTYINACTHTYIHTYILLSVYTRTHFLQITLRAFLFIYSFHMHTFA
jgi:hypothetical protein